VASAIAAWQDRWAPKFRLEEPGISSAVVSLKVPSVNRTISPLLGVTHGTESSSHGSVKMDSNLCSLVAVELWVPDDREFVYAACCFFGRVDGTYGVIFSDLSIVVCYSHLTSPGAFFEMFSTRSSHVGAWLYTYLYT